MKRPGKARKQARQRSWGKSKPDRRKGKATGAENGEDPVCTQDSMEAIEAARLRFQVRPAKDRLP